MKAKGTPTHQGTGDGSNVVPYPSGKPQKGRGAPPRAIDFDATYRREFESRVAAGKAWPTVKAECRYLSEWGERQGAAKLGDKPLRPNTIRLRLTKLYGLAAEFKEYVRLGREKAVND